MGKICGAHYRRRRRHHSAGRLFRENHRNLQEVRPAADLDITNEGKIKIAGKGIGIYANNNVVDPAYPHHNFNNHVTKENAVVNNKASLELGDESIGILTKKATINLTGTGTNDISVGKKGIRILCKRF